MTKLKGVAKFLMKHEGKEVTKLKVKIHGVPLPGYYHREKLEMLCDDILEHFSPGDTYDDTAFVDSALTWATCPSELLVGQMEDLGINGYIHPELYEALKSWREQLKILGAVR